MRWIVQAVGIIALATLWVSCARLDTPSTNLPPSLRQAETHLRQGDVASAQQAIDTYLQQSASLRSYLLVVSLCNQYEQYRLSAQYAQRALNDGRLRLNTLEEAQLWQIRADALSFLEEYEAAARCYDEVLRRTPANPVALNNYAYLLAQANTRLDEAESMVTRALAAEPNNPIYLDTLGWIYYQQGRYQQAVQILERAVQDAPREAEIRYHLGMAYWKRGRIPEAKVELRKAANLWRIQKGKPYQQALDALQRLQQSAP